MDSSKFKVTVASADEGARKATPPTVGKVLPLQLMARFASMYRGALAWPQSDYSFLTLLQQPPGRNAIVRLSSMGSTLIEIENH